MLRRDLTRTPPREPGIFTPCRANLIPLASLLLGSALRVLLAIFNRQANDDHVEVVLKLLEGGRQPSILSCNECFQPKLYHIWSARIAEWCDLGTRAEITVAAQLLNVVLGLGVLALGYVFIARLSTDTTVRALATSWIALNPRLLAINVQATNDTFVILLGAVVLVALLGWIQSGRRKTWLLLLAVSAAALSPHVKGSGIVIALVTLTVACTLIWLTPKSHRLVRVMAVLLVFGLVVFAGARVNRSYGDNYRATGELLPINMPPSPMPFLFRHTIDKRPGVTSLASAFLTFRILDLVETPYIPFHAEPPVSHKTSLWSQLYGRTYVLHYDQWPPSWRNLSTEVLALGRISLLLGLVPASVLALGVVDVVRRRNPEIEPLTFMLYVGALLAFMVAYSTRYRDVGVMKVIFMFPALLAFLYFYVEGLRNRLHDRWLRTIVLSTHAAMLCLWVVEVGHLLLQLMTGPVPTGAVS